MEALTIKTFETSKIFAAKVSENHSKGATHFGQLIIGQLFFGQINLANYFM